MISVFISSLVRGEMAEVRNSVGRAVEALGMRPVMFERDPASELDSQTALLDRVKASDVLILILGAEYGEAGPDGASPTEQEFRAASDNNVPVLVLEQKVDREPAQEEFVGRVRGSWSEGHLTGRFTDASDVSFEATKALTDWQRRQVAGPGTQRAQERVLDLLQPEDRFGGHGPTVVRVAIAPAIEKDLLGARELREADKLPDAIASLARTSGLVGNSLMISAELEKDYLAFTVSSGHSEQYAIRVGFDGSVMTEAGVAGEGPLGSSVIDGNLVRQAMARSADFAEAVWRRIDESGDVREVALACAIPDASFTAYAPSGVERSTNSMQVPMGLPSTVIAPESPLVQRREDLTASMEDLEAELHRAFQAAGALHRL